MAVCLECWDLCYLHSSETSIASTSLLASCGGLVRAWVTCQPFGRFLIGLKGKWSVVKAFVILCRLFHYLLLVCHFVWKFIKIIFLLFFYFCRRIGLANGIVTAGSGVGTIAMGPLMQLAVNYLGWAHAARVLGGILSLCTIGSLLYKVPSQSGKKVEKAVEEPVRKRPPMFDFTIFKNKAFLIYCLSLSAFMMGYFVPFVHLVSNLVHP